MAEHFETDPTELIESAIRMVLAGDLKEAASEVDRINPDERWEEKQRRRREAVAAAAASGLATEVTQGQDGRNVSQSVRLAVFARDHYICRYAHCGRHTIDERVFAALARVIPHALAYHPNWGRQKAHPIVWTHLASFEHVKPWSVGGDNSNENLVTTCSLCNYTKMNFSPEQLGWSLRPEPPTSEPWDGLLRYLVPLQKLAPSPVLTASEQPSIGTPPSREPRRSATGSQAVPASELVVGDFVMLRLVDNKTALRYRVVGAESDLVDLVQLWRSSGRWSESNRVRTISVSDYPAVDLISHHAPVEGDVAD